MFTDETSFKWGSRRIIRWIKLDEHNIPSHRKYAKTDYSKEKIAMGDMISLKFLPKSCMLITTSVS